MIKNIIIATLLSILATLGFTKVAEAHNDQSSVWVKHDKRVVTKNVRTGGIDCVILAERILGGDELPVAITCNWNK